MSMNLKNKQFLKVAGLCAIALAASAVVPTIAGLALGGAAAWLYAESDRSKNNFLKMGGAILLSAAVSPSVVGIVALAGYGYLTHSLMKDKGKRLIGTPYDQQLVEQVKTKFKSMSAKR